MCEAEGSHCFVSQEAAWPINVYQRQHLTCKVVFAIKYI